MLNQKEQLEREKQKAEKLKALRRELEEKLEEQLPPEMLAEKGSVDTSLLRTEPVKDPAQAKRVIEALLFATAKPLTLGEIRKVLRDVSAKEVERLAGELKAEYERDGRSFEIVEVAGGWEVVTKKEYAPWIFKMELQKKARQVTQSALETLAILAYKQPVTRAEIEELRGVDVSGVMTTLTERDLIKIVGRKEVPGRPFLYGTTEKFLEHFGLKAIQDLPNIEEIRSYVENSVKKEDLLGTQNLVAVPQEPAGEPQGPQEPAPAAAESGEPHEPR